MVSIPKINRNNWDNYRLPDRVHRQFEAMDKMSPEMRECVHEFGAEVVNTLIQLGINTPNKIRGAVHVCWKGARAPHQRGAYGEESPIIAELDWLLMQKGAEINARTLIRVLKDNAIGLIPLGVSSLMVDASMATVTGNDVIVSKPEKHRRRIQAALDAAMRKLWPFLYEDGSK